MVLSTPGEIAAFRDLVEEAWGVFADMHPIRIHEDTPTPWPVPFVVFPEHATLADVLGVE